MKRGQGLGRSGCDLVEEIGELFAPPGPVVVDVVAPEV